MTVTGGAASLGVRTLLAGPVRRATVVSAHPHAVHLQVDGGLVVAVVDDLAVRLPNAVLVARGVPGRVQRAAGTAAPAGAPSVVVGGGGLRAADLTVRIGRWWQPRPALPTPAGCALADGLRQLGEAVGDLPDPLVDDAALRAAAGCWDRAAEELPATGAILGAADALLGRGVGLTPTGDDIIAGTLSALVLVPAAAASAADPCPTLRTVHGLAEGLADLARGRTGAVSASLLAHAARGEVVPAAGRVLRALLAPGDGAYRIRTAVGQLGEIGHTSGAATARGLLTGARAAARLSFGGHGRSTVGSGVGAAA